MFNIYYLIAIVGNRVVSFGTLLVLAYVLTPHEFGVYTLAFTNAVIIQSLASNWILIGGSRYIALSPGDDTIPVSTLALAMMAVLALFLLAPLLYAIAPFTRMSTYLVALVGGWASALLIYDLTGGVQNARQEVVAYTRLSLGRNLLASALALIGGRLLNAEGAIAGQIVGALAVVLFLPSARGTWRNVRLSLASLDVMKAMFRFGAVGTFATSLYMATGFALRNSVGYKLGDADAGLVALGSDLFFVPIALFVNTFAVTQMVPLNRSGAEHAASESRRAHLERFLDQTLLVILPYIVGGALLADRLVAFVLPGSLGERLETIATPAALFGASLGALYGLTASLLIFKHHRALVILTVLTVGATFGSTLYFSAVGLRAVLWAAAGVAAAAAIAGYLELAIAGGARLVTPARVRILLASGVMGLVVWLYTRLNTIEPISAVLLGLSVYAVLVVKLKVIGWRDLLNRKLRDVSQTETAIGD